MCATLPSRSASPSTGSGGTSAGTSGYWTSPTPTAARTRSPCATRPASDPVFLPAPVDEVERRAVQHALGRPAAGPSIALRRQLARGVDAQLAAPELLVRSVIEVVDRTDGVQHVVRVV